MGSNIACDKMREKYYNNSTFHAFKVLLIMILNSMFYQDCISDNINAMLEFSKTWYYLVEWIFLYIYFVVNY